MRHVYWVGGRVRQIPSPYGVGGETGYTAQEDLKSINSYNMGEERMIRVWFFCSCIPRPSLVLSPLSSLGYHTQDVKNTGYRPQIAGVHMKGMISMSSVFASSYTQKSAKFLKSTYLVFLNEQ